MMRNFLYTNVRTFVQTGIVTNCDILYKRKVTHMPTYSSDWKNKINLKN